MADGVQDEGIKISAPFFDVKDAGDVNLIFSSSFPSIAVAKEFNASFDPYESKTLNHNMNFPPLIKVWAKLSSGRVVQNDDAIVFDSNKMMIINYFGEAVSMHIKVYAIDISISKDYPFIQQPQGVQTTYDPNYGIKVSKEGKSVDSTDLTDYIIHSRTRSPLVLHVEAVNDQVTNRTITYTNPAGYVPWVMGFGSAMFDYDDPTSIGWTPALVGSQAYPRLAIDPSTGAMSVNSQAAIGGLASLVVLRDPLFASVNQDVIY